MFYEIRLTVYNFVSYKVRWWSEAMKIATYNLRFGGKASQRIHWQQIFETIDPDIFLVQETCNPQLYEIDREWVNYQSQIH